MEGTFSCTILHFPQRIRGINTVFHFEFTPYWVRKHISQRDISDEKDLWWLKGQECLNSVHTHKSRSNSS